MNLNKGCIEIFGGNNNQPIIVKMNLNKGCIEIFLGIAGMAAIYDEP